MTLTKAVVGSLLFWLMLCCIALWLTRHKPIYIPDGTPIVGTK